MHLRLLLPLCAAMSWVAAEDSDPLNDLRFEVSLMAPPKIQERVTAPDGTGASYTWNDLGRFNLRYEVMYLQGMSRRGRGLGGFVWGLGAIYGSTDITPGNYSTSNGLTSNNSRDDLTLKFKEYGLSLAGGLATAPRKTDMGAVTWEILPIGRFGMTTADTVTPGFTTDVSSGRSTFWEGELRGAVTLADNGWLIALHAGWVYSKSKFDIDLGSTGTSQLQINRNGPEVGLEIGFRY